MAGEVEGLFNISLSDSEDGSAPSGIDTNGANGQSQKQSKRTGQTEDEFQAVRAAYTAKVENGEVWKTMKLPLGPQVVKQEAQALLHAVEELYFFKRFDEGARFVRTILEDEGSGLDEDTKKTLQYYEQKCQAKMASQ